MQQSRAGVGVGVSVCGAHRSIIVGTEGHQVGSQMVVGSVHGSIGRRQEGKEDEEFGRHVIAAFGDKSTTDQQESCQC